MGWIGESVLRKPTGEARQALAASQLHSTKGLA